MNGAAQENDRFGGREEHVRLLRNCTQSVESSCAAVHLQQCQMEGFPTMHYVERLRHHSSVRIFRLKLCKRDAVVNAFVCQRRPLLYFPGHRKGPVMGLQRQAARQ